MFFHEKENLIFNESIDIIIRYFKIINLIKDIYAKINVNLADILTIVNKWLVSFQSKLTLLIRGRVNGDSFYGGETVILDGFPR